MPRASTLDARELAQCIEEERDAHGACTYQDLATRMGVSKSTAFDWVHTAATEGWVTFTPGRAGSIRLVEQVTVP